MALTIKGGATFLHIPKTGGSWISKVLGESELIAGLAGHKHDGWDRIMFPEYYQSGQGRDIIRLLIQRAKHRVFGSPAKDNKGFTFCFVRDPLSWYESWWKYMTGLNWSHWGKVNSKDNWHPNAILNGLGSDDFNQFVRNVIEVRPGYVSELYAFYVQPGISFIGKTEHLKDDLVTVLKHLNIEFDEKFIREFGRVNVSKTASNKVVWDEDLKEVVKQLELPARIHYGYLSEEEKEKYEKIIPVKTNPALRTII